MNSSDFSKRFTADKIAELFNEAPNIAPDLVDELYDVLEKDGVEAVNELFRTKGTFDPKFVDKKGVLEFIILLKRFSGLELDVWEKAILNSILNRN